MTGRGQLQQVSAVVPGANRKIAFASNRDGNYEVYVMNADGSAQTNLINNAAGDDNRDHQTCPKRMNCMNPLASQHFA